MGWLDTPQNKRKQHLQMIAMGNIKDVDRIQRRERRRKIFIFLDFILAISIILGIFIIYSFKDYTTGFIFIAIGIIISVYFIYRRMKRNSKHRRHRRH